VENGDIIEIDLEQKKLELQVSPEELQRRREKWQRPQRKLKGALAAYRAGVGGAEQGAPWLYRDDWRN
jgi:dihydroxy-acid dehydratase